MDSLPDQTLLDSLSVSANFFPDEIDKCLADDCWWAKFTAILGAIFSFGPSKNENKKSNQFKNHWNIPTGVEVM